MILSFNNPFNTVKDSSLKMLQCLLGLGGVVGGKEFRFFFFLPPYSLIRQYTLTQYLT